jgi:SAM-dependent methyltransferase
MDRSDTSWAGRDERVFTYLPAERSALAALAAGALILDLGCSDGPHIPRLSTGGAVVGVDVALSRLRAARELAPVAAAVGERLPFRPAAFDMVYVSHVLHHAADPRAVLREIHRVLKPGGVLFLIETCEDSPLMRLARTIRPEWDSDPVRSRFRFAELLSDLRAAGFRIETTERFNVLYWVWGFARKKVPSLERLQPFVVRAELAAVRRLGRFAAYGWAIGRKPPQGHEASSTAGMAEVQEVGVS